MRLKHSHRSDNNRLAEEVWWHVGSSHEVLRAACDRCDRLQYRKEYILWAENVVSSSLLCQFHFYLLKGEVRSGSFA